jgi:single-strand DNA-binding protein
MNIVHIAGRLGADPEVRFTSGGQKVTVLRVAARVRRGKKEETNWWKVTIWGEEFDNMLSYFKKGSAIIVIGDMNKPEIFTDRDGKPQISLSLTAIDLMFSPFGSGKSQSSSTTSSEGESASFSTTSAHELAGIVTGSGPVEEKSLPKDELNDEIPF